MAKTKEMGCRRWSGEGERNSNGDDYVDYDDND